LKPGRPKGRISSDTSEDIGDQLTDAFKALRYALRIDEARYSQNVFGMTENFIRKIFFFFVKPIVVEENETGCEKCTRPLLRSKYEIVAFSFHLYAFFAEIK
jgi:hypothetical protein